MENVATLGLEIHGEEGTRQIKVTREELIKLANAGKDTEGILKRTIPPTIVPPQVPAKINEVTAAIKRMREEAAKKTAETFATELSRQMKQAEEHAMRLQRGLDGVRAAQQRMLDAARASQARAMAGAIAARDPFQNPNGFDGPQLGPLLPPGGLQQIQAAEFNVSKLRQGLTSLAIAATGVPGPIGQVSSSLAPLAFGGGVTVGVLAGIAAMAVAFDRITANARRIKEEIKKATDAIDELVKKQQQGALGDLPEQRAVMQKGLYDAERNLRTLQTQQRSIAAARAVDPAVATALGMAAGTLDQQIAAAEISVQEWRTRVAGAEKEISRIKGEEEEKRTQKAKEEADKRKRLQEEEWERQYRAMTDPYAEARSLGLSYADRYRTERDANKVFDLPAAPPPAPFQFDFDKDFLFRLNLQIDQSIESLRRRKAAEEDATKAIEKHAHQVRAAQIALAQYALGQAASRFDPRSGASVIAQAGAGVVGGISGGIWGMVAGGVIGLASGLFGLSDAAKEHKRQLQREAAEREKLIKAIELETQVRNAPNVFFLPSYQRRVGSDTPTSRDPITGIGPRNPLRSVAGDGSGALYVTIETIQINGNRNGREVLREIVHELDHVASSYGGIGLSRSKALELLT